MRIIVFIYSHASHPSHAPITMTITISDGDDLDLKAYQFCQQHGINAQVAAATQAGLVEAMIEVTVMAAVR
jgi:hypothetical protein